MEALTKVGIILAPTTTYLIKFVPFRKDPKGNPINIHRGDLLVIRKPGERSTNVFVRVIRFEKRNVVLDEELAPYISHMPSDVESMKDLFMEPSITEYSIGVAEILGEKVGRIFVRPREPPMPGDFVYRPAISQLKTLFKPEGRKSIFVGFLRGLPQVPVYLDPIELVSKHFAILAMTGSGKSYTAAVIIEELAKTAVFKDLPIIIFDPHGEYVSLLKVENEENIKVNLKIRLGYVNEKLVQHIMERGKSVSEKIQIFMPNDQPVMLRKIEVISEKLKIGKDIIKKRTKRLLIQLADIELYQLIEILDSLYGITEAQKRILEAIWPDIYTRADSGELVSLENILENIDNVTDTYPDIVRGRVPIEMLKRKIELFVRSKDYIAKSAEDYENLMKISDLTRLGKISVVDLSGLSVYDQQIIVSIIMRQIMKRRVLGDKKVPPVLIILEEAHRFAPSGSEKSLSLNIVKRVAQEGRKFFVGLCVISQRPSRIHPDILSQCNSQIILRLTNPEDQLYVRRISEYMSEEDIEEIKTLSPGEAMIFGPSIPIATTAIIRPRGTKHGGATPSIEEEISKIKQRY